MGDNQFVILEKNILFCNILNDKQKILYAIISNLCNNKLGYCFASNTKLSEYSLLNIRNLQKNLKILEKLGFIKIKYNKNTRIITTALSETVLKTNKNIELYNKINKCDKKIIPNWLKEEINEIDKMINEVI